MELNPPRKYPNVRVLLNPTPDEFAEPADLQVVVTANFFGTPDMELNRANRAVVTGYRHGIPVYSAEACDPVYPPDISSPISYGLFRNKIHRNIKNAAKAADQELPAIGTGHEHPQPMQDPFDYR